MDIKTYLSGTETAASLARKLGISPVLVSQWRNGYRPIPVERCSDIERATDNAVTRRDIRPDDWHRIWPELIDVDHPAPVEKAAA
jgi:DNA-binding transcriptional regulator YdaS (Cro superfamily)